MRYKINDIALFPLLITCLFSIYLGYGQCAGSTTTWNGAVWDNGIPDLTKPAILNAAYDTGASGSFSACDLTVNATFNLNIDDNTYVEVQNDLIVNGTITVQTHGAFVQIDNSGSVSGSGTTTVTKTTSSLNNWYEYTYWSSPVSGETIGNGLFESEADRRFSFNAQNFEDSTMETNNDNTAVAGQDDIDDNNDDWQWVSGATVMNPGVGYATTHDESLFVGPPMSSPPYEYDYTFEGDFNNGIINVSAHRNDGSTSDNNWNFVGNPYPSAISISSFFTKNVYNASTNTAGTIENAIYFWSQNTAPSSTANGDNAYNFANSDYAVYNGTGGTAGGDGVTPTGFIPSGQGFFVNYDEARPSSTGTIVFNNAMRVRGSTDNSQFFKNVNTKGKSSTVANKLWLNLTSDNGVYNQILIGYVNGATSGDDGLFYDATKTLSINTHAALFSTIENSDKKFTIQGKSPNSLNTDEIITLGFTTNIDVPTLYKFSLANIEGSFLKNNAIYIKDKLLNKTHDLTVCDYTFTSEVGEFNSRFEIVFNNNTLSDNTASINASRLKISALQNDYVQFEVPDALQIKSIRIFDLLGRQVYQLHGNSHSETFKLSNINTIFITTVELSDGSLVTKKVIKS